MRRIQDLQDYLAEQGINVTSTVVKTSLINSVGGDGSVQWSPLAILPDEQKALLSDEQEAMSLASMLAVHQLQAEPGMKVLDTCSAPGMKALYLSKLTEGLDMYCNDVSSPRMTRMRMLFDKHSVTAHTTKHDARRLSELYPSQSFDRILLDAPCSGEGVICAGNQKLLQAWSPAKVRRLQQLQIKILKDAWTLLKPGGRLVYATCTLNKNENERVLKKALKFDVSVTSQTMKLDGFEPLAHNHAWRILPSEYSIGFFIAVLEKADNEGVEYEYV
jgi:16S rRNA (cytosine967-C5)-methyltransferase